MVYTFKLYYELEVRDSNLNRIDLVINRGLTLLKNLKYYIRFARRIYAFCIVTRISKKLIGAQIFKASKLAKGARRDVNSLSII